MNKQFTAIKKFVNDLGECFATENHSLALYDRLLSKVKDDNKEAITRHMIIFRDFITRNKQNIIDRIPVFDGLISFSPKIYIDLGSIFASTKDQDTIKAMWEHLSVLVVIFNPDAKQDIVEKLSETLNDGEEDKFLNKIIQGVSKNVVEGENPQASVSRIFQSNFFPELLGDLNQKLSSGNFDMTKMLSSVQKMTGNLQSDPQTAKMMGMLDAMKSRHTGK